MTKTRRGPLYLASISLDPADAAPLHRQLYFGLRAAILESRLPPGARLPSTRSLAGDLGVSRNTVLAAFEQLLAEGYIQGRVGAGSFVSCQLPEEALHARKVESGAAARPRPVPHRPAPPPGASG
jgi:GntR family transcriptional regulator / MocR family aminotransferase